MQKPRTGASQKSIVTYGWISGVEMRGRRAGQSVREMQ